VSSPDDLRDAGPDRPADGRRRIPTTGDHVQIRLLGTLEVLDDSGQPIPLKGSKLRALIALLALEAGRVVSADRLIDAIYGEKLPLNADNALQALVSSLRRATRSTGSAGPSVLSRGKGYLLDVDPEHVDAIRFASLLGEGRACAQRAEWNHASAHLHAALDLWRGAALAEFTFNDFASGERARLEELRLLAIEACVEVDLELGRAAEWVGELEHLVVAHPLREGLWAHLMTALYRQGRQAEALRAFQQARRELAEQLGLEPGPELCRLEAAILAQDPSLTPPRPAVAAEWTGNLAAPLTACLGRETELAAVHALVGAHRLVTLVGPGGTGKTRLAVEVGLTGPAGADDGVWMVDLAPVSEPEGVVPAVGAALRLHSATAGPGDTGSIAALASAIGSRTLVILLDNCEHVIAHAARVAAELVGACPNLRILATSREGLGIPGEVLSPVAPLGRDAAIQLFVERANAADPTLRFDAAASSAVADICARLDGLPLAIELAAARARALDVAQIATRLSDRFQLLTVGPRTAMPRQRTLRAVIDWSYDLLEPAERLLFERLSVFPGGARLSAIEAVCAGDGIDERDVAELVSRLVDKSLLTVQPGPDGHRYAMLQSLAEYAGEHLAVNGRPDVERRKHADWVLALVRAAERGGGSVATVSLAQLEAEMGQLDAAMAWAGTQDASRALEIAGRLGWFWFWTGRVETGWTTLASCLDRPTTVPEDLRARAMAWAGLLGAVMQAPEAETLVDAAVERGRECGDSSSLANVLAIRATLAILQAGSRPATADLDEAAQRYEESGDRHGRGMVAMLQGLVAAHEARAADAAASYEESIRHFSAVGDHWAAGVSHQRLAELAEIAATPGLAADADAGAGSAPVPAGDIAGRFSRALIRAQLTSVRSDPAGSAVPMVSDGLHAPVAPDPTDAMAVAVALHIEGRVSLRQDQPDRARAHLESALQRYRGLGRDEAASTCLSDLGRAAARAGDTADAARFHAEATAAACCTSDASVVVAALEALAALLAQVGDGRRAGWTLGAADVLREAGARPWDIDVDDRARAESVAIALVGRDELDELRRHGRTMRVEEVLDDLRNDVSEPSSSPTPAAGAPGSRPAEPVVPIG
jgi:predicted ATPase/DNA-binding SARP family transcriptional activator